MLQTTEMLHVSYTLITWLNTLVLEPELLDGKAYLELAEITVTMDTMATDAITDTDILDTKFLIL